ncbi:MAG: FecR family protein [Tannerella sp.]|nr:FecR family protein [Tannerella sp.]
MDQKYIHYTAQQLLHDEKFLSAENNPTEESRKLWDELADKDENFARELKVARTILAGVQKKKEANQLSSEEELSLWNQIEQSKNIYKKQRTRRLRIGRSIAAAAAVLALCIISYQLIPQPEEEGVDYHSLIPSNASILNDQNKDITLIISDQDKISLSGKEATVNYQKGYIEINSNADEEKKAEEIKDAYNQLIVPKGKRSFVTLADGTQMWVNAGSTVIYPANFTSNKREIYVEGEIYLDVTPDKNKPFIVKTQDMNIQVLGTQFNVSAYKEDEMHHIILVEGKVEVILPDKSKQAMQPNQQLIHKDNNWNVHEVTNLDHLAWRYGYYQYKDQTIAEIVKNLNKYYGETISYDETVGNIVCTGKLDLKNDFREVIEALTDAASLQADYSENKIYLYVKP